jgi:putative ABC transport system permease protein
MLKHYLVTALSNLLRYRLFTAINLLGLAVSLASCLLIGLYVHHELGYDSHYAKADRLYRVSREWFSSDGTPELQLATIASQAGELLEQDFPQVLQSARLFKGREPISTEDVSAYERDYWADAAIFELFDFEWLEGDPRTALSTPNSVVLTESVARKYFGSSEAMDGTLLSGSVPLRVTGVIRDLPDDTHFDFNMLGSMSTLTSAPSPGLFESWSSNFFHTYILLDAGAAAAAIQDRSGEFMERHYEQGASRTTGFTLMPLTDIHLDSDREGEMGVPGSRTSVIAFSATALFILLIACFNFMNLATARANLRAKEVGLRKSVGAERSQLVWQFLGETVVFVLLAVAAALTLAELTLPAFSTLMGARLSLGLLADPAMLGVLGLSTLAVGALAGSYPAFYLSSFQSASVLRGDFTKGRAATLFREVLVVSQFAITITLLIASVVVYLQTEFARKVDVGYDREQVVVLNAPKGFGPQWAALKNELLADPQISSVTASSMTPAGAQMSSATTTRYEPGAPENEQSLSFVGVDAGFFETYGVAVLAGRSFSSELGSDRTTLPNAASPHTSGSFVLSETTVRQFGWTPEEAVGKWFEMSLGNRFGFSAKGPIVGVVADVNYKSIRSPMEPLFYYMPPEGYPRLTQASIKISGIDVPSTLGHIEAVWNTFMPGQPLSLRFVAQDFAALYQEEARQTRMFSSFTVLAISVACLGLLGLASYATERRTREIAVRKVMGGSVLSIVLQLTGNFSKLVLLANLFAWPVAYIAMQRWLEGFAYRIDLTPLIFIGSGAIALCIAWVTVGGIAAKAASARPILALRYE